MWLETPTSDEGGDGSRTVLRIAPCSKTYMRAVDVRKKFCNLYDHPAWSHSLSTTQHTRKQFREQF